MNLSKSRYVKGIQCPKMLWMDEHMPEQFDDSVMNRAVLETGSLVGDLAMGYYGDFVEVTFDRTFSNMVKETRALLDRRERVICEATFAFEGDLCMVDILLVEDDGVRIVEVKSSTHVNEVYYHDMAFQAWLLGKCGMNVKGVGLMHLNGSYVRRGELDLRELFAVEDCSEEVLSMQEQVDVAVPRLKAAASACEEPVCAVGRQCKNPYECGYRGWCWRHVPKPSVFDLNQVRMDKALGLMNEGVLSLGDAAFAGVSLSRRQQLQVDVEVGGAEEIIDAAAVRGFLDELSFPLYFLDFETYQPAVPPFDGVRPYQQIPTQYSLHILRDGSGDVEHREFLAEAGADPRRAVAEHLVEDIPVDVCVLAYNMSFEKGRIRELAEVFPDLAAHLLAINGNMRDLITPFRRGDYYARAMGGSNSIKAVLPALFPNDPELDYASLEGVHNGSEAMAAFSDLAGMGPERVAVVREQLLRYCELDTLAMVRIWEKLREKAGLEG